LEKKTKTKHIC